MKGSPFVVFVPCEAREYAGMKEPQSLIGGPGEEPGRLKGARGITVDKDNRIIVCDRNNFRVQVFDASGEFLFTFGKKGKNNGEFANGPQSVTMNKDGKLFVCDYRGTSIQMFNSNGEFLKKLHAPKLEAETPGKFSHVVASNDGRVYVADCDRGVIYAFDSSGEYLTHFKLGVLDEDDGLQGRLYGIATNSKGEPNCCFPVAKTISLSIPFSFPPLWRSFTRYRERYSRKVYVNVSYYTCRWNHSLASQTHWLPRFEQRRQIAAKHPTSADGM